MARIDKNLTGLVKRQVKSTTDTLGVGTRKAIPVNFLYLCEKHVHILYTKHDHIYMKHARSRTHQCLHTTYPSKAGITLPTAFAAPVVAGIIF